MLRPADRVDDRRGSLAAGVLAKRRRDLEEVLRRAPADIRDHLGRVAGEVPAHELEHASLVLHRVVEVGRVAALELDPVRAVSLVTRHLGLLFGLARGRLALGLVVAPAADVVRASSGSQPEKNPSAWSSASRNSGLMITGPFVKCLTYSRNHASRSKM